MKDLTREELDAILDKHKMWLRNSEEGEQADFFRANLKGADLKGADLRGVHFFEANLNEADLSGANLSGAYFGWARLNGVNLEGADLSGADLYKADLTGANLSGVSFYNANLCGAYLIGAKLSVARLGEANLEGAKLDVPMVCPEKGSFIGYKRCAHGLIVTLEIPEDALRSSGITNKCRCSKAKVISISRGLDSDYTSASSLYDFQFKYRVGEVVSVDNFDTDRWNECSTGIHFFMTRREAVEYNY